MQSAQKMWEEYFWEQYWSIPGIYFLASGILVILPSQRPKLQGDSYSLPKSYIKLSI